MGMEDGALEVMRKKNTSMLKAVELVKEVNVMDVVSAGSTGAFLTASTIRLKLIEEFLEQHLSHLSQDMMGKLLRF